VAYEFGYQITLRLFKVRYPKLEGDEDPFAKLRSDVEVLTPIKVPFDDRPATPPTLPPPS
ncbi:hypothetical protein BHM03_00056300, partial [Ensete ventricosum]